MWWTDDVSYLWVGGKARSKFSESNADLKVDYASLDTFGKKRFSYPAEQGRPVPIKAVLMCRAQDPIHCALVSQTL